MISSIVVFSIMYYLRILGENLKPAIAYIS